ncbi:unnamed protein product [Coregonus sp. 'balchen']|nr:unnamed protein product [Coregonus sp. 'balchen']
MRTVEEFVTLSLSSLLIMLHCLCLLAGYSLCLCCGCQASFSLPPLCVSLSGCH